MTRKLEHCIASHHASPIKRKGEPHIEASEDGRESNEGRDGKNPHKKCLVLTESLQKLYFSLSPCS